MFSAYQLPITGAAGAMDPMTIMNDPVRRQQQFQSRFTSPTFTPTGAPLDVSPLATSTLFQSPLDNVMTQLNMRSGAMMTNPLLASNQTGFGRFGSGLGVMGSQFGAGLRGVNPLISTQSQYGAGLGGLDALGAQSSFGLGAASWNPALSGAQMGATAWGSNPLAASACGTNPWMAATCGTSPLSAQTSLYGNPVSLAACNPIACHPATAWNPSAIGGTGLNPTLARTMGQSGLGFDATLGGLSPLGASPQSHWILQGLKYDRLHDLKTHNYIEGAIDLLRGIRPTDQVWSALISGVPVNPQVIAQAIQIDRQVDVRIADLVELLLKVSRRFNEANSITEDLISGKTYTGPAPNLLEVGAHQQKANLIKNELVNLFALSGRV